MSGTARTPPRRTTLTIRGDSFHLNGQPTYRGRSRPGKPVEGLLLNARMVQGVFDDRNPETRPLWNYPDGPWDPDRNTRGFIDAMPEWRRHGLLGFTLNLQGGHPHGYGAEQPWHNSAFESDGSLCPDYLVRLERILDRADQLGMAPILGYFYFGQDERLADEDAVVRATDNATDWLLDKGYANVLVEINNECDHPAYEHDLLRAPRVSELIERVQRRSGGRLLVSASMCGGALPPARLAAAADFLLLHGNGVDDPARIRDLVDRSRAMPDYRGQPILFNEDDHYRFDQPDNNFLAAVGRHASWGYFDYRRPGEGFDHGYQSVPADWRISSPRKRAFFTLLADLTGAA